MKKQKSLGVLDYIFARKLAHINRFGTTRLDKPETVASHSFFVAEITMIICELLKKKGHKLDAYLALKEALVHDKEEGMTGDIVIPAKEYDPATYKAILRLGQEVIKQVFAPLPSFLKNHFISLWQAFPKRERIEDEIVWVADKLAGLAECLEYLKLGNRFFDEPYRNYREVLVGCRFPWLKALKSELDFSFLPKLEEVLR